MKKKKLKAKSMIITGIIFVFIGVVLALPLIFINIKLIGSEVIELDYGEKYSEPGYMADMFNSDVTDDVEIDNNVKEDIGSYEVTYNYKFLFYNIKRTRQVVVADLTGPEITLKGDKELSVTINTKYEEPGYDAIDKLDGDLTQKVKVTNNVDITKLGDYEVVYEVEDNSGNLSKVIRKVKVEKLKPTQMSIKDYTLDGWYEETKLKKTKDYGNEYFNKITMVGDSNTMNMYYTGFLTGVRAWAIPCLHAESMHNIEINLYGLGIKKKLLDAVTQYKPEMLLINFGTFSTKWISEEVFIEKANLLIEKIKEISPNTKIMLISIYPIKKGNNDNNFTQDIINKYNFLILEMANKHGVKYLDVQEVLKGPDGYGKEQYFINDKFHLTNTGFRVVKEYIKTHAWEDN